MYLTFTSFFIFKRFKFLTEIHCYVTFRILVSIIAILFYIIRRPLKIKVVYFHPINTNWTYILCKGCARCWERLRWIIMVPALGGSQFTGKQRLLWWMVLWSDRGTQTMDWGTGKHSRSVAGGHHARWERVIKEGLQTSSIERNKAFSSQWQSSNTKARSVHFFATFYYNKINQVLFCFLTQGWSVVNLPIKILQVKNNYSNYWILLVSKAKSFLLHNFNNFG